MPTARKSGTGLITESQAPSSILAVLDLSPSTCFQGRKVFNLCLSTVGIWGPDNSLLVVLFCVLHDALGCISGLHPRGTSSSLLAVASKMPPNIATWPLAGKVSPIQTPWRGEPACVGSSPFNFNESLKVPWFSAPLSPTFSEPGSSLLSWFDDSCRPTLSVLIYYMSSQQGLEILTGHLSQSTLQVQCCYLASQGHLSEHLVSDMRRCYAG